jgi:hypothetical protein
MSINLKNFRNFGDISSLCEMIKSQYNKNQSHHNFLNTKNESENFKLSELYIDNIDIIPTINDLICNSNQFNINNLSARRNAHLFKCSIIEYVYPIILLIGLIGNMISLITMIRIYRRKKVQKTLAVSLAALALADVFVLIFGCSREWIETKFNVEIKTFNNISCRIILYLCYSASSYSAWIHVFITMERCIAVYKPFDIKRICSNGFNRLSNIFILILCLVINFPLLYFAELDEKLIFSPDSDIGMRVSKFCQVKQDRPFINGLILFTDSIFYCLLPFILIFIFSFIAIFKLIKTKSVKSLDVKAIRNFSIKSRCESNISSEVKEICCNVNKISHFKETFNLNRNYNNIKLKHKSNLKTSVMLLSLPICYITTVLPIVILILIGWIDRQRISSDEIEEKDEKYFEIAHSISSVLMYVNSSINILLYILFGKNLRQDFLSIIPCMNTIKSKSKRNRSKLFKYLKTKEHISINGITAISKKQTIECYNSNL